MPATDSPQVHVSRTEDVAVLTLDNPPVNALAERLLVALDQRLRELDTSSLRAIVIVGAGDTFVAGADIERLQRLASGHAPGGPSLGDLLNRIEGSTVPVVAAIDRHALGGGLELAMSCHYRVATQRARLGLPELGLGLIPGAGGTQRLPRLIGVTDAAEMMLTSKPVDAATAHDRGLVDLVVEDAKDLQSQAIAFARDVAPEPPVAALLRQDRLPAGAELTNALDATRSLAAKRFRNVAFPTLCVEAIVAGIEQGGAAGLAVERSRFEQALRDEPAQAMIHLFFAERAARKVPGVTDREFPERPRGKIGVIGGGTMGSGIATALLNASLDVCLVEVDADACDAARNRVAGFIQRAVDKGRISATQAAKRLAALSTSADLQALRDRDVVIEAATEDVALKQALFQQVEGIASRSALLVTNTSTIDIAHLGGKLESPARLLGMHFFSPAHIMPLVEVIRTKDTEPAAVAAALDLCKQLRKTPVTVGNCPGFLVNRVFMPYGQLAGFAIDRGVHPYHLDRVMYDFGMPMGPCRVSDLAGIDVGVAAGQILDSAYAKRAYRSPLRRLLADAGRIGQKAGAGHYLYENGKAIHDADLDAYVEAARAQQGHPSAEKFADEDLVDLLLLGVVNEASRIVEDGIVVRPSDIDVAVCAGMGFPRYRGGPLHWADRHGSQWVVDRLQHFADRFELPLLQPTEHLKAVASAGTPLLAAG